MFNIFQLSKLTKPHFKNKLVVIWYSQITHKVFSCSKYMYSKIHYLFHISKVNSDRNPFRIDSFSLNFILIKYYVLCVLFKYYSVERVVLLQKTREIFLQILFHVYWLSFAWPCQFFSRKICVRTVFEGKHFDCSCSV